MKKIAITLVALGLSASTALAANPVRISQVYGGGGNSGAPYNQDFVELFNSSAAAVDISGWSLQYGSATGTTAMGSCTNCKFTFAPGTVIAPCGYLLFAGATGANGVALPVTPDVVGLINMSGTTGKIGLKADAIDTPVANCPASFVDQVGYGTANCFEGAGAAPGTTNTTAVARALGGVTDTDNNNADFATTAPTPRNSQSVNPECTTVSVETNTWGRVKAGYR